MHFVREPQLAHKKKELNKEKKIETGTIFKNLNEKYTMNPYQNGFVIQRDYFKPKGHKSRVNLQIVIFKNDLLAVVTIYKFNQNRLGAQIILITIAGGYKCTKKLIW